MNTKTPMLSNRAYDIVKWFVLTVLPAFSAAYFGMGNIVGLPHVEAVVGCTAILATFLSAILGISNASYSQSYDGEVLIEVDPGGVKRATIHVPGDPEELLMNKDELRLQIMSE